MKKSMMFSLILFVASFALAQDPVAPYSDYGAAMSHKDGVQMAVEWHNANAAPLATAVDEDVLADIVADETSAAALLAQVKGAYNTDPMVATQIAAVSQWVMGEDPCFLLFWKPNPSDGRKVWVKQLLARAETANDTYVTLFCLDQLRWCGCTCPCVLKRIEALGEKNPDKAVKDMVSILLRTLR